MKKWRDREWERWRKWNEEIDEWRDEKNEGMRKWRMNEWKDRGRDEEIGREWKNEDRWMERDERNEEEMSR